MYQPQKRLILIRRDTIPKDLIMPHGILLLSAAIAGITLDGKHHQKGAAPECRELQNIGVIDVEIGCQHCVQEQCPGRPQQEIVCAPQVSALPLRIPPVSSRKIAEILRFAPACFISISQLHDRNLHFCNWIGIIVPDWRDANGKCGSGILMYDHWKFGGDPHPHF